MQICAKIILTPFLFVIGVALGIATLLIVPIEFVIDYWKGNMY